MMDQQKDQSNKGPEKKYWQSVEDVKTGAQPDETGEFQSSPIKKGQESEGDDEESRRTFLKVMGAGFAMLSASACTRRPVEKIVPYVKQPEEIVPGIANWYASTCTECESACGVLVKTREGRPLKFEGNPQHPVSQGGLCARGQASVLNVYDPDRLPNPVEAGRKGMGTVLTWDQVDSRVVDVLRDVKSGGGKVRILTGEVISPSTQRLISDFTKGFEAGAHVVFEPLSSEEVVLAGEASYGTRVVPRYRLEKADMVVSFGADFLGTWQNPVEAGKNFSKTRKLENRKEMSRYVAFESILTTSGTNADSRYTLRSGDEVKAALAVAHELIVAQGHSRYASDSSVTGLLQKFTASKVASETGVPAEAFKKTAKELWENKGKGIVFGGGHAVKGDAGIALEVVVNLLNSALENEGATIDGTLSTSSERSSFASLLKLVQEMKAGLVDALFIYKTNPVYSLAKGLGFEEALAKVKTVVFFGTHLDETAKAADFVCATNHAIETWGDASPQTGVFSIQQPTIAPMHNTRAFEDSLIVWAKKLGISGSISSASNWYEYLKNRWKDSVHSDYGVSKPFAMFWDQVLREGVFDGLAAKGNRNAGAVRARSFGTASLRVVDGAVKSEAGMTLVLYPKVSQYDGRVSNNAWLQELPDPVTKITWDNYANIAQATAKKMGLSEGDIVRVKANGLALEVPAHIQPGMHAQTVAIAVGYGRQSAGRVGTGIGVNVFPMAVVGKQALALSGIGVELEKTGRTYKLASTQKHHSLEGREIIKEATLGEFKKNSHAGNEHHEPDITLWSKHKYEGYRWAMAIDLNSCTGCSACVIGCQSENNIPVVGKEFVLNGREMHWMRIDRYYAGDATEPETVHQPMLCQHCENAPCETVCPVLATMHDDEGLNQQVYNRCVGTRYCSNNCPYKVRRFNWFTFTDVTKPLNLAYNPDVTVRTRGIMEKCTFCIQRIREAKDHAKDLGRVVQDGEVKTACQQSCPSDAIAFGNINDKNSRVAKLAAHPRGFTVLEELNVRPAVTYLTKIRNKEA